jgi:hypothetical protein
MKNVQRILAGLCVITAVVHCSSQPVLAAYLKGEDVKEVEAVSWLDGTPGRLVLNGTRASLPIHGGTGVLIKAR